MAEGGSARVLVVEDDELTRTFLHHALQTARLDTVNALNGGEGLNTLGGDAELAAVIIDGLLPDMHGWDLATRILELPGCEMLPMMFLTGALRHPIASRAGIAAMLKPIRVAELVGQLNELLAWRAAGGSPLQERREVLGELESSFLVGP